MTVIAIVLLIGGAVRVFTSTTEGIALCLFGLMLVLVAKSRKKEEQEGRQ